MTEQTSKKQYSLQASVLNIYIVVFVSLDILTSVMGIYYGIPSSKPIKVIGAAAFAVLIAAGLLCTRIILKLDDSNQKQLLLSILFVCIGLDTWTSFEGLHKFVTPNEDDFFGWFLLIIATLGCSIAPIVTAYSEDIKNKLRGF